MNKEKQQLFNLTEAELSSRLEETQRELFGLRLYSVTSPIKDTSKAKKLKRSIARLKTYLRQKKARHE